MRRFVLFAAALDFAAACTHAQAPASAGPPPAQTAPGASQQTPYRLQVSSQIVVLDVVVDNQKGEPVRGLKRDDFNVYEDKVPQSIRSFEETATPPRLADRPIRSTAELDKLEPDAPVSILVLDEVTTKFADEAFARYSLERYLKSEGDTLAQPTMLLAVNYDKMVLLRDYTTSRQEILDALNRHFNSYNWRAESGSWMAEQFAAAFSSLMGVAEATMGHRGHKNLIWIGRGFPSFVWENLEEDQREALQTLIETCTNLLRDARVTLYTIDPAGITVAAPASDQNGSMLDSPFSGQVDFDAMAEATGGQALHGRNDVDRLIQASVNDGESFYTLSYRPDSKSDAAQAFRNIRVIMKDPNLRASTREGYFASAGGVAPPLDEKGKATARLIFDMGIATQSLMVYDGVPFTIVHDPAKQEQFLLKIAASELPWESDGATRQKTSLTLLTATFDKKGKQSSQRAQRLTAELPQWSGGQETRTVNVPMTVPAPPGTARIRFVVRAEGNGRVGADNFVPSAANIP